MKEKKLYTPKEVAQMCEAYLEIHPTTSLEGINNYDKIVPPNVQTEIFALTESKRISLLKILNES